MKGYLDLDALSQRPYGAHSAFCAYSQGCAALALGYFPVAPPGRWIPDKGEPFVLHANPHSNRMKGNLGRALDTDRLAMPDKTSPFR